jgi:RNA polymerase sigma-70 factor, ECF subfamily
MSGPGLDSAQREALRASWDRFVDELEPLRPELFRLALRLAGNAFDAEDLVHDALLRAFGSLGFASGEIRSPRAYLCRVLTNLWIDECRRARRGRRRSPSPCWPG